MNLFAIPGGELDVEVYQTLFRAIVFDTLDGAVRKDYQERVVYQEIIWKPNKKKVKSVPIILGGEPIWIGYRNYPKRQPASYQGKPMDLILQIAENFNFEKLSDAPPVACCQGLFNTVHRIFKKSTQQKPGAKWLPACSYCAYSCSII